MTGCATAIPVTRLGRLLSSCEIRFSLRSPLGSSLFLLALLVPSLAIAVKSVQIGIALTLADSFSLSDLQQAAILDPANDEIQDRLGIVAFYWPTHPDEIQGLEHLRRATLLNPSSATYNYNLASACEAVRDYACVQRSFERALVLGPMVPRIHWLAANAYLRTGRVDAALAQFRALLELAGRSSPASEVSAYIQPTFRLCLRIVGDPQTVAAKVLPAGDGPALELQFVNYLSAHDRLEAAYPVWTRAVAHGSRFPFSLAGPYLAQLMKAGRYETAEAVWGDLIHLGIVEQAQAQDKDELVFNGGFEQAPLDSGFDWCFWDRPYPSVDFSDSGAYRGARCLRIDFTAKWNDEYEPVFQFVPVIPGQRYTLSAFVRSKDITSDSGPRLRVLDPDHPKDLDESTDGVVGRTDWHQVNLTFSAGADTRMVRVSVWRPQSRSFPYEISGNFWLDEVSLKLTPQARMENQGDPKSDAHRSGS